MTSGRVPTLLSAAILLWVIAPHAHAWLMGFMIPAKHSENYPKRDLAYELVKAMTEDRWSNYFPALSFDAVLPIECESPLRPSDPLSNAMLTFAFEASAARRKATQTALANAITDTFSASSISFLTHCVQSSVFSNWCSAYIRRVTAQGVKAHLPAARQSAMRFYEMYITMCAAIARRIADAPHP